MKWKFKFINLLFSTSLLFCLVFFLPYVVNARKDSGNYINDEGCLVVWHRHTILWGLISYGYHQDVFCNSDGSPIVLGD